MKKLAMIVTRGTYNNLLQVSQLARIAAESGSQVSLFFRDEAAGRLTSEKVKELTFSEAYRGREAKVREMLRERKLNDFQAVLRELKDKGDVKLSVCRDSLEYFDLNVQQLIPELDEVQRAESFWKEEVEKANQILTF